MTFQIKYGPEVLNEFDNLADAKDEAERSMAQPDCPTLYVYDTEEQRRYDAADWRQSDRKIVGWQEDVPEEGPTCGLYDTFEEFVDSWRDSEDAGPLFWDAVSGMRFALATKNPIGDFETLLAVKAVYSIS